MAMIALHGVSFRNHCKPGKEEHFGFFNSEIQLDSNIFQPFGTLSGRLILTTSNRMDCEGIRIQLDATVNLNFQTKMDNRVSSHKKMEGLLQDSSEPGDGYYILSPVREDITMSDYNIVPGTYTYTFTLTMPGESLPSPFKSPYGNLQYKVVAYMKSNLCYVQVAEKPVRFRGYNNISELLNAFEPIKQESGFQKSIFSSKKVITSVLSVEKAGFLPGEDVSFRLIIANPKSFMVKKFLITLSRRVSYNVNGATKTTLANLDTFESNEISRNEEISFVGKLTIQRNCMPTYNVKQVYSVVHLIQYQVKVAEYPGPMKGQVEIVIGTTKEPVCDLMSRRMSTLQVDDHSTGRLERSDSISSRLSDSSIMTTTSLPAYSQLSSRAVSMLSLETLPPHYDDLM